MQIPVMERIRELEGELTGARARVAELETVLREAGVEIPAEGAEAPAAVEGEAAGETA